MNLNIVVLFKSHFDATSELVTDKKQNMSTVNIHIYPEVSERLILTEPLPS